MAAWYESPWFIGGVCLVAGAGIGALAAGAQQRSLAGLKDDPSKSAMSKDMHDYLCRVGTRPTAAHKAIQRYTYRLGRISRMCISADEGQFLEFFAKTIGARTVVEVGCFTGYGTLSLALGSTGTVFTLDISDEHLRQAEAAWKQAGVRERVQHIKAPALESLKLLERVGTSAAAADAVRAAIASGSSGPESGSAGHGSVDLMFVDADKANYPHYVESAHRLLRKGGVCLVDNTLWAGRVIDPTATDEDTLAIKALNAKLHSDPRWELCLAPIADGVTMLRKL